MFVVAGELTPVGAYGANNDRYVEEHVCHEDGKDGAFERKGAPIQAQSSARRDERSGYDNGWKDEWHGDERVDESPPPKGNVCEHRR